MINLTTAVVQSNLVQMIEKRHFASDNYAGVHPDIMKALVNANQEHATAYGDDRYTEMAVEAFRKHLGDVDVHFVFNGTAANVLGLRTMLDSHNGVVCYEKAHINVDECGAPEINLGTKLFPVLSANGKLTPDLIRAVAIPNGDQHRVQPRVISITQSTECGTVYRPEEIKNLSTFAKTEKLFLHMDGARISNAAASLSASLKTTTAGADVLSFGGTKNGMMFGEAVVFFNKKLAENFKFYRKQHMQLASKNRFIAAQFLALLSNDLWLRNAQNSNKMAALLAEKLGNIKNVSITQKTEANGVFARIPSKAVAPLQEKFKFYVWEEFPREKKSEVRWMASFDTTSKDVDKFAKEIASLCK